MLSSSPATAADVMPSTAPPSSPSLVSSSLTTDNSVSLLGRFERYLTQTRAFQAGVSKAFQVCDHNGEGVVDENELYTGLIMVHLTLAKHAGSSACYPPTRAVCDRHFAEADKDGSGTIDRAEFHYIVEILCANILSRMLVYYLLIILGVPVMATFVVELCRIPKDTYYELVTRESLSFAVLFLIVPLIWNMADARSNVAGDRPTEESIALLATRRTEQRLRRRQKKSQQETQQQNNSEIA